MPRKLRYLLVLLVLLVYHVHHTHCLTIIIMQHTHAQQDHVQERVHVPPKKKQKKNATSQAQSSSQPAPGHAQSSSQVPTSYRSCTMSQIKLSSSSNVTGCNRTCAKIWEAEVAFRRKGTARSRWRVVQTDLSLIFISCVKTMCYFWSLEFSLMDITFVRNDVKLVVVVVLRMPSN